MKNLLQYSCVALALALCGTASLSAERNSPVSERRVAHTPRARGAAPEVDPSLAIGGITLLAGSLTVLRARRRS